MRIAILTSGRFHVLDLARELSALGHDVRFYSLVPPNRTREFGLPAGVDGWVGRWLGPLAAPGLVAQRLLQKTRWADLGDHALNLALDHSAALMIERCDALIAMSGMSVRVLERVRRRFGARIFLERGSRHIRSQRAILDAMPGAAAHADPSRSAVPDWVIAREEAGYALADAIVVPSLHVERSFAEYGIGPERLFRNPYGTSLQHFPPTPAPPLIGAAADSARTRRVIMVGAWSLRKGADVLVEAMRRVPRAELVHVGGILDAPRSSEPFVTHVGFVPQKELTRQYAGAHVFALASREEGLAVVQVQALASGLPLVCTDRTGGEDLARFATPGAVHVVPPDDPAALATALEAALDAAEAAEAKTPGALRDLLGAERESVSWAGYARRWDSRLKELM